MPLAYCWCPFISCTLLHTTSKMWTSSSFGSECHLIRLLHFSSQFISCLQHSSPKGVLYSQNLSINLGVWEHLLFNYIWLILYHCIWFFTPNTHNWFEWSDHRSGAHTFYMCVIISWWFTHQTLLFKWCISDHKDLRCTPSVSWMMRMMVIYCQHLLLQCCLMTMKMTSLLQQWFYQELMEAMSGGIGSRNGDTLVLFGMLLMLCSSTNICFRGHTECCTLHSQSCKICFQIGFNWTHAIHQLRIQFLCRL